MKHPISVVVDLIDREDGGIDVRSKDLPGLILSGLDRDRVVAGIIPGIRALLEFDGEPVGEIVAARSIEEVLKSPSPRQIEVLERIAA